MKTPEYYWIFSNEQDRWFIMNEKGYVTQYHGDKAYSAHVFSETWVLSGVLPLLPFGRVGMRESLRDLVGKEIRFKNGRGKYVIEDIDHGTTRHWGSRLKSLYRGVEY